MPPSTRSPRTPGSSPLEDREVTRYLRRLVGMVAVGLVVMIAAAAWAWTRYGPKPGAQNPDHPRPTWKR